MSFRATLSEQSESKGSRGIFHKIPPLTRYRSFGRDDTMLIIDYNKKYHRQIIEACVKALKLAKVIAYPTDTSYGLAVDATNVKAIKKLYKLKGRNFNKPIHVIPPSIAYAKKIVKWNKIASKLSKKFWPGGLTLVLGLRASAFVRFRRTSADKKGLGLRKLSANSGWLGMRMPKNKIALDLAKKLGRPITTTSANFSGLSDCYSATDIVVQFRSKKLKPDIIIDAGKLPERKPSTVVRVDESFFVFRKGHISDNQIKKVLAKI